MNDMNRARAKLAEGMGWQYIEPFGTKCGDFGKLPAGGGYWEKPSGQKLAGIGLKNPRTPAWNPFTDANDERAVFRHMMQQGFSTRQKYWRALRHIINERTDKLTQGGIEAAWPDAIMFLEDGDWALAALRVIQTVEDSDRG